MATPCPVYTGGFDGMDDHLAGLVVALEVRREPAFVSHAGRVALLVQDPLERMERLRPVAQGLGETPSAERHGRLCGLQKHLLMQITGLPNEGTLRSELNSVLAGITATLRTIVKNDEDSE